MPRKKLLPLALESLVCIGLAAAGPAALAHPHGPPPGAGNPHSQKHRQEHGNDSRSMPIYIRPGHYFTARQREHGHSYYARKFKHGNCPPGLARKHDGCMPPGQARRWSIGQRLPDDLKTYPVSGTVITILGSPPNGYRYVRVASDILLVATGTHMVIDAINDLGHS